MSTILLVNNRKQMGWSKKTHVQKAKVRREVWASHPRLPARVPARPALLSRLLRHRRVEEHHAS